MKKVIRLTEGDLRRIVRKSVGRIIKESITTRPRKRRRINERNDRFDQEAFNKWEEKEQIPKATKNMVNFIAEKIGADEIPFPNGEEETVELTNRGGYTYGYGKGFSISHCTYSLAEGPGIDYSREFKKFVEGLGFEISNSYGDNGMDPAASNGRDTYWTYEFIYSPSIVYEDNFMIWDDDEW